VTEKTFIMLHVISIPDKCSSFELFIHLRILKKRFHNFHKILSSMAVFNIDNRKCVLRFLKDRVTLNTTGIHNILN